MRLSILSLAATLTLAGCVSVLPEPEAPDALYRISAIGAPIALNQTVIIKEPEAPQIMSGRQMVREDAGGAIRLIPGTEWAGRSTRLLQLALVDSFGGGRGSAVLPESGVDADYELSIRLTTLGFEGERAVCSGAASLIEGSTRKIVAQDRVDVSHDGTDTGPNSLKTVSETCVGEFAAFLSEALKSQTIIDK